MTDKISPFPPSDTMTPAQALLSALQLVKAGGIEDVLIVGYASDGDLFVRSSRMSRKDALWLAEQLRRHALEDDEE